MCVVKRESTGNIAIKALGPLFHAGLLVGFSRSCFVCSPENKIKRAEVGGQGTPRNLIPAVHRVAYCLVNLAGQICRRYQILRQQIEVLRCLPPGTGSSFVVKLKLIASSDMISNRRSIVGRWKFCFGLICGKKKV